jgi:transcriptional regulator with XRE-family HTH domain
MRFTLSIGKVEYDELCRYAQNYRGDIVFYDRYIALCKEKGVSASYAAVEAGISKSLITKWKKNTSIIPSPEVLQKLAAYFNVTVAVLLDEDLVNAHIEEGKTERERLAGELFNRMTDDKKDQAIEYMQFLLRNS